MKRIAIIEDHEATLRLISYALRNAGYAVDEFTGITTKQRADLVRRKYSLYVIDLVLPHGEFSGEELIVYLRSRRESTKRPILVVTAKVTEKTAVKSFELGVTDFVRKPFSPRELTKRVDRLIEKCS